MMEPHRARSRMIKALHALATVLAGVACVPALNLLGGELASALALPRGGNPRLACAARPVCCTRTCRTPRR